MNVHYCVLFRSRVRDGVAVSIRFSDWLVSDCTHVFVLLSYRCHRHTALNSRRPSVRPSVRSFVLNLHLNDGRSDGQCVRPSVRPSLRWSLTLTVSCSTPDY